MASINVFYDHQIFSLQKFGGISRYHAGLIKEFQKMDNIEIGVGGIISDNPFLNDLGNLKRKNLPPWVNIGRKESTFLINSIYDGFSKKTWDIYHPTYYYPQFFKKEIPIVVTVHDMTHEKFPQDFSKFTNISRWKKELLKKASRIIAISENTKKDIIEIFSIPAEKIDVVYHCSELSKNIINGEKTNLPKKYILYIGNRGGYKNFSRFIEAMGRLFSKDRGHVLVLGGGGVLTKLEAERINKLGISNRVVQKNLSDPELISAYSNAACFVFPSLYEGFGIPILEAFQCECPVVLSNSSSFPEVAGDAGVYFDPYSIESIEEAISKVIANEGLRNELTLNGSERLKFFSQKKVALETLSVYQKALS